MDEHDEQHGLPDAEQPPALTAAQYDEQSKQAQDAMAELAESVTQREWLIITRKLDQTRPQIGGDSGLTMLALAWVKEKRAHGGADFDRLLDMTDAQLSELHGFPAGDRPGGDD
jgi:uncharacterized protein (DUF2235 family)